MKGCVNVTERDSLPRCRKGLHAPWGLKPVKPVILRTADIVDDRGEPQALLAPLKAGHSLVSSQVRSAMERHLSLLT